jgi:hypothetical protein
VKILETRFCHGRYGILVGGRRVWSLVLAKMNVDMIHDCVRGRYPMKYENFGSSVTKSGAEGIFDNLGTISTLEYLYLTCSR